MDTPLHMMLLDERPSGKLCVTYQKLSVVDAIDEILATTQRIPNLDIAKTRLTTLSNVQFSRGNSELLIGYNCESGLQETGTDLVDTGPELSIDHAHLIETTPI